MADDPKPQLDPTEALIHIRSLVAVASVQAYGTPAEATFREIRAILDKALPPRKPGRKPAKS